MLGPLKSDERKLQQGGTIRAEGQRGGLGRTRSMRPGDGVAQGCMYWPHVCVCVCVYVCVCVCARAHMRAKSLQLCPILRDPRDHSLPGSSVHGVLQARILKGVAIAFSRRSFQPRDGTHISDVSCIGRQVLHH